MNCMPHTSFPAAPGSPPFLAARWSLPAHRDPPMTVPTAINQSTRELPSTLDTTTALRVA